MIYEWNLLRTIACLSIVFLHSTTQISYQFSMPDVEFYRFLRIALCYATPTFIILSEIILSNKYNNRIPDGFFKKRIKYILFPFIAFAFIDAMVYFNFEFNSNFSEKMFSNLLGNYEGYFILIILQFYVLHYLVVKLKINMLHFLPFSFVIMFIHLYLLNFSSIPFIVENRNSLKLLFTAWIGYFSIAYVIGSNYKKFLKYASRFKWYLLCGVIISLFFMYYSFELGYRSTNSRRPDLFPLVISFAMLVLYIGSKMKTSRVVNLISNYSLGIYLVHWQVQRLISPYIAEWFGSTLTRVMALFVISLIISMIIIRLFNLIPFGEYIVGKIRKNYQKNKEKTNEKSVIPKVAG